MTPDNPYLKKVRDSKNMLSPEKINFIRKHITFETLDDVYTDEEKRNIVSHYEMLIGRPMNPPIWGHLSQRLRQYLIMGGLFGGIFGYKWTQQCGHWVMMIVKTKDTYKEDA